MKEKIEKEERRERLQKAFTKISSISVSNGYLKNKVAVSKGSSSGSPTIAHEEIKKVSKSNIISLTINMGEHGLGLTLTPDEKSKDYLCVTGFRTPMPKNAPNPSIDAGLKIGDKFKVINGVAPSNQREAVSLLKKAKGKVVIEVVRN